MKSSLCFLLVLLFLSCSTRSTEPKKPTKPNIILIMVDDMGYSDLGYFGSEIATPNIDQLAENGMVFSQFYNTSRCCPSRAALLTGLYQHQAGVGDMTQDFGRPAYQGFLSSSCPTLADLLKTAGYQTMMSGKWHLGQKREQWPDQRGFDQFYGIPEGGGVYFYPFMKNRSLILNGEEVQPDSAFYSTSAFNQYACRFIDKALDQENPFFLYLPHIAPHFPLQAPKERYEKYIGKFMDGFQVLRDKRLEKMQQMGILSYSTTLSEPDPLVLKWDSLSKSEQERFDLEMAIYAAQMEIVDDGVGDIIQLLKEKNAFNNTVILFLSDNGATSEEKGTAMRFSNYTGELGSPESYRAYHPSWGNLSNTPFRMYKHWVHEGGISSPFIANYPDLIKKHSINHSVTHIMDIMPSLLELASATYKAEDQALAPEGKSFIPILKNNRKAERGPLFWEHEGNRAARDQQWKIVSAYPENIWHLYDIENDRMESTDLSRDFSQIKADLIEKWEEWADRVGVVSPDILRKN